MDYNYQSQQPPTIPLMNNTLYKTKMCRSVSSTDPCKYGSKCQFAHSKKELVIQQCRFGNNCRFVCFNHLTSEIDNAHNSNICKFIHENETKSQYFNRCNPPNKLRIPVVVTKQYPPLPPPGKLKPSDTPRVQPPPLVLKHSSTTVGASIEKKISVPRSLALATMSILMDELPGQFMIHIK